MLHTTNADFYPPPFPFLKGILISEIIPAPKHIVGVLGGTGHETGQNKLQPLVDWCRLLTSL